MTAALRIGQPDRRTYAVATMTVLALLPGCFNHLVVSPFDSRGPLEEVVIRRATGWTAKKVAILDVSGLLLNSRKSSFLGDGEHPVSEFREKLQRAAEDPLVRAVVLRINSPGGGVTASDIMYRDLVAFREKTGKPVVACLMDVAASGGYYVALGSDAIFAHPTSVTGSIGVIMNLYNFEGLCSKLGISSDPIKSGPNKDLGNPARRLSEEERQILQHLVDEYHDRFVKLVALNRHIPEAAVRRIADGRVYSAREAKELGLVDQIGYLDDALAAVMALAGLSDAHIVTYSHNPEETNTIYARAGVPREIQVQVHVPVLEALAPASGLDAAFLYLWMPGVALP